MIINYKEKLVQIKVVYYGCALSGKTTSLKSLFKIFNKENSLKSIETTTGRTLFFDFGTLNIKGGEWNVKFLLYSATGQDFYASTRPAILSGADGIVFLIDSRKKYLADNNRSWRELNNYYSKNILKIPIIICLNKQDLHDLINMEILSKEFNLSQYNKLRVIETVATNGVGVLESFKGLLQFIFPTILIK